MNHDAVVLEIVSVIRVAIGAGLVGFTGRNSRQGAGEKTSTAGIGPTGMCGGPNLIAPSNDIALRIHSATYFHYHGRSQRFPAMFVVSHPLYADGLPDGLGEERCISRSVIRSVVAVAAGRFDKHHTNVGRGNAQQLRDGRTKLMRSLGPRPDRRFAVLDLGKAARRANGSVQLEWPLVSGIQCFGRASQRTVNVTCVGRRPVAA